MKISINNRNKQNIIAFSKDNVKITTRKMNMKFSRRKSNIDFTSSNTKTSNNLKLNKTSMNVKNYEHSHKKGDDWLVSISSNNKSILDIGFDTRSKARDFSKKFNDFAD